MYGIFIGRFQPFHNVHEKIVRQILQDKLIPIIVIGSANASNHNPRNPLSYHDRKRLVQLAVPELTDASFVPMNEFTDCNDWYNSFAAKLRHVQHDSVIYF